MTQGAIRNRIKNKKEYNSDRRRKLKVMHKAMVGTWNKKEYNSDRRRKLCKNNFMSELSGEDKKEYNSDRRRKQKKLNELDEKENK